MNGNENLKFLATFKTLSPALYSGGSILHVS